MKVLILDDNKTINELLAELITILDPRIRVIQVTDARKLKDLDLSGVDLVSADFFLGDSTVVEDVLHYFSHVPKDRVVITSCLKDKNIEGYSFMAKPFDIPDLEKLLDKAKGRA